MNNGDFPKPSDFFTLRVHRMDLEPSLTGLCAGYELGKWREDQLANHTMEWLPEFSLTASECVNFKHHTAVKLLREAATRVYTSNKFANRGEFGELLLHAAIRQVFDSLPAVSKIYYKSSNNDTVKGFDAVHVVGPPDNLELWLGEAKFYSDIKDAISSVVNDIRNHLVKDYLRDEFLLIMGKIDSLWPHAAILKKLLQPETSLDEVFKRVCIPVLLTYNSDCINKHTACDDKFNLAFKEEIDQCYSLFRNNKLPDAIRIHLFLVPIHSKDSLVNILDVKLKAWQNI